MSGRIFVIRYGLKEEKASARSLIDVAWTTLPQLIIAVIAAVALQLLNPYLLKLPMVAKWVIPAESDYVTLLATISGIGGVFIGLYYAAVASVGGAIYSRMPNNIRNLLAHERVGNIYMRYLSFLTFLALCLIGLRILGYPRLHLAVFMISVMSGVGIIAFVKLGQRAFNFFDPTILSLSVFQNLCHWIRIACVGGYRWNDLSFQQHAHKQAQLALETLSTLSDISAKEDHLNGRPFVELSRSLFGFLIFYQNKKKLIPSDSHWYTIRYTHRDWYKTDDTMVSIAHQTGTGLQRDTVNDKTWIEEALFPIVLRCISINLKAGRFDLLVDLLGYVDAYVKALAQEGEVTIALNALGQVADAVLDDISQPAKKFVLSGEVIEHIGLMDYLGVMPITILLAYISSLNEFSSDQTSRRLAEIRWQRKSTLYKQGFSAYILPRLEWLQSRLSFEISVEDEIISPLWYQTELIAIVQAEKISENTKGLIFSSIELYQKWFKRLETEKHPWLAAAILSREWEYCNKTTRHSELVKAIWKDISERRYVEGLVWPVVDVVNDEKQIKSHRNEIIKTMAKQGPLLLLSARTQEYPDYGGQFLHATGESILDSLIAADIDTLKTIFSPFFYGCAQNFENMKPKTSITDWRSRQEFQIAAAPLLDLMELSGYARLFADFHDMQDIWAEITRVWDEFLNQEKPTPIIQWLAAVINLTSSPFGISHRGILRAGWKQNIMKHLRSLPRKEIYRHGSITSSEIILHKSPLVRIFAQNDFTMYNGIDIFIDLYLRKRNDAISVDFGRTHRDLEDRMARAEKLYNENIVKVRADADENVH